MCKYINVLKTVIPLLFAAAQLVAQPNINRVEYYVDTDPGYGIATAVPITQSANVNASFSVNIGALPVGLHIVGIRSRNAQGVWSMDERWLFVKQQPTVATPNINRVEWYLDRDPGYGNANTIAITPGTQLGNLSFTGSALDTLAPGLHVLGVRSRNAQGAWSMDERWLFIKQQPTAPTPNITAVEWYLDKDPGYGKANAIAITPGAELTNLNFAANSLDTLTAGLHVIGVRSRNAAGAWSLDEAWLFVKQEPAAPLPNIMAVEWYLDRDPGYGNGRSVAITPGAELTNLSFSANNLDTLMPGLHILGVRSQDANQTWSMDERWLFVRNEPTRTRPLLTQAEYYVDADPGRGNAIPLAITQDTAVDAFPTFVNLTGLAAGKHTLVYRTKDANGSWSFDDTVTFTIATPKNAPFINVNSISSGAACKGGDFTVGYHATGVYNAGNQFIAELSNQSGSFANPLQIGAVTSTTSGLIPTNIPENSVNGSGYKLRIRSTNPVLISDATTQNISLDKYVLGADTFAIVLCGEDRFDITKIYSELGAAINWSIANPTAAPIGIHSAYATNAVGCKDTALVTVKLNLSYWTGSISSDWHLAANWSQGIVPGDSTHVVVNNTAARPCIISNADAEAASVQVLQGAPAVQLINTRKLFIKSTCEALQQ